MASRASQRRVLGLVELRARLLDQPRAARRRRPRRRGRRPRRPSTSRRSQDRERRERRRLPRLERRRNHRRSPRPRTHDRITLGEDCEVYPRHVAKSVDALRERRRRRALRARARPRGPHPRARDGASTAATRCLQHLQEILGGPIVWAPGVERRRRGEPAGRRLPVRLGRGSLDRIREPRRRRGPALSRGELQLPGGDPGGRRPASGLSAQGPARRGASRKRRSASEWTSSSARPYSARASSVRSSRRSSSARVECR